MFFIALGVVFVAAVAMRIRSYSSDPVGDTSDDDVAVTATSLERATQTGEPPPSVRKAPAPPDFERPDLLDEEATRIVEARRTATSPPPIPTATAPATVGSSATAPPRSAAPPPQQQQRDRPQQAQPRQQQPQPDEARDDTSDSTPPQLGSIEFQPPQISDGEETMMIVQAIDDLSGVRSISGTITAPSGAVQGFACQREGDTNRYIARVMIPKEAAEGEWMVSYLNLMDHASNAAALTIERGGLPPTARFRVVSMRPDSEGPSLEAVWLDRRSMRGGEKNLIFVRAQDDKAGVNLVSGIFQSPSRVARVGFVCRTSGDGLWTCELNAPSCADCGEWHLEQLQMQDKANNMTTLRAAQSPIVAAVRLDIASEACDSTPPSLQSIALDTPVVSSAQQSTITVTVALTDDACGVLSVSGQATGPPSAAGGAPPRLYFSFTPSSDPATWTARLVVPRLAANGTWRVSFLQVLDRGQNLKTYTPNDPVLAGITFIVD